jgi:hypothetical protein
MRKKGVRPDKYEKFEELLAKAGIGHLPRLNPMMLLGVTFWNYCIWPDDKMIELARAIEDVLFTGSDKIDITSEGIDSHEGERWLNRQCDVHGLWCHIHNGNEVFLTTDSNYKKKTKQAKLLALGARRICHPDEL